MADRPPPLRLVPTDSVDGSAEAPPAAREKRKLPKNLYFPAPTMTTIWCRFSIGGVVYRRTTGCRDVRNAERRAVAIRIELEAEDRGIAPTKRILLKDSISDFGRHISTGRGGVDRQEKISPLRREESGATEAVAAGLTLAQWMRTVLLGAAGAPKGGKGTKTRPDAGP